MRIWGSCISELFSLKLSYIQIFFSRIQYSPSDFQILWIKLTVRSSWKKELTTKYCPRRTVLCCWKNHRIKQLKQTQDDQFKKIYYCWSIFSSPCWTQKTFVNTYFKSPCLPSPIHAGIVFTASLTVWEPWKQDHEKEAFSSCWWPPELPLRLCLLPREPMT